MILRLCVVIPTYNNPLTIEKVVEDVLRDCEFPILVVDDGSEVPVAEKIKSSVTAQAALQSGRLRILRWEKNRGKGFALQNAIQDCVAKGFTHLLAFDADGQHMPYEIKRVAEAARENPWSMIIGHRRMQSESIPESSKFGRKFSNFWVNYETGHQLLDSQSGFRVYPLFFVQNMKFWTKRYDFEIEILIRLIWKEVPVHEVDVDVFYPDKKDRVSHFDKFWDNARLSVLNTALVTVSLLRAHHSPLKTSLALGVGVLIGCTPFFGFHGLIAAAFAFIFRLNFIFLILGTQVSIPPLAPFLAWASVSLGSKLGLAESGFLKWLYGSFVLGLGLGSATILISYPLILLMKKSPKKKVNWTGKDRGGKLGNGFLRLVLKYLGRHAGYFCLFFVTPYFYFFAPTARRGLNEFWKMVKPEMGWLRRQFKIERHFYRFGMIQMDRAINNFSEKQIYQGRSHGLEHIQAAFSSGKGFIVLNSHMGGWDLAASLFRTRGMPKPIFMVEYGGAAKKLTHVKSLDSAQVEQPIFDIHTLINQGNCVGMMGDRPMNPRFELLPFMGKLAPFDVTPFRIAAALKVPVVFTFGFKFEGVFYNFYADAPREYIYSGTESREIQNERWAQEYADRLAEMARKHPDQWFNLYEVWSSLPVLPTGEKLTTGQAVMFETLTK